MSKDEFTFEEFIARLHGAGWREPLDAQWSHAQRLYDEWFGQAAALPQAQVAAQGEEKDSTAVVAELESRSTPPSDDARDAERYRWLADNTHRVKIYVYDDPNDACSGDWLYKPRDLNEVIDTAMADEAAIKAKE